jgi:hypothetical protein
MKPQAFLVASSPGHETGRGHGAARAGRAAVVLMIVAGAVWDRVPVRGQQTEGTVATVMPVEAADSVTQRPRTRWEWSSAIQVGPRGIRRGELPATSHYPELQYMAVGEAPDHLRSRVPLFLTLYADLLGDEPELSPEQQARRILGEVYGCTAYHCALDFSRHAASYDHLVQGITRAVVLKRVLAAGSEQELAMRLRLAASGWSTTERLAFIQQVGRRLFENYDHSQVMEGPEHRLDAFELVRGYQTETPRGTCGAIANAQAWMLREMGFTDAFVVTSRNYYYPHATVVVRDPDHTGRLIKIDYDKLTESSLAAETAALRQAHDESISYFIYRIDGGLIANLHTELGMLLHEQAGGRLDDLDQFARQTAPAVASVSTGRRWTGGTLTAAALSDGTRVIALMGHIRAGRSAGAGVEGELGGGGTLQTGVVSGYTVPGFYVRSALRYTSPWAQAGDVGTRAEASVQVSSRLHLLDFRGEPLRNRANVAQHFRVGAPEGRIMADLRIGTQYLYHFDDPRDHGDRQLARNYWFVDGNGRRNMGRDLEGLLRLTLCVRHRDLGPQVHGSLGLKRTDGTAGIEYGYLGRTDEERLSLAPGSARTLYVACNKDLKVWSWQARYEHSLDGHAPTWRVGVARAG